MNFQLTTRCDYSTCSMRGGFADDINLLFPLISIKLLIEIQLFLIIQQDFFYYYVHDIARVHLTEEQTFHIFFYHSSRSKNFKITFFQSIPFKSIKLANAEEFSNRYRKKKVYLLFQSRSLMNFLVNCWVGIKSRRKKGRKSNLQSTSSHYTSISLHLILFCQYWRIAILALSLTPLSLPHSFIVPLTALKMKFK